MGQDGDSYQGRAFRFHSARVQREEEVAAPDFGYGGRGGGFLDLGFLRIF